jgi:hypothetical protein
MILLSGSLVIVIVVIVIIIVVVVVILQALSLLHGSQMRGAMFYKYSDSCGTHSDCELVLFARPGWSFRCRRQKETGIPAN